MARRHGAWCGMRLMRALAGRAAAQEPDGVDLLLQSVAHWRKRDPQSADEQECCANLYDCLCSAMVGGRAAAAVSSRSAAHKSLARSCSPPTRTGSCARRGWS